jgi:hypothetical protein
MSAAERTSIRAFNYATDLTTKLNAAKTWAGNRILYFPAGGYSFTTLDFKGNLGGIIGDGVGNTVLKVRSAVARALDFKDVTDANPRQYTLKGFSLDGNGGLASIGLDAQYRHQAIKEDLFISGCGIGIKESDTYLCYSKNIRVAGNATGWWLVGSNHASSHVNCTADTNTTCNWLIQNMGIANDGNEALGFDGCVNQSAPTGATGWDVTCSSAFFKNCYYGENNVDRAGFISRGGLITFEGGTAYYGFSATSYGITPLGGRMFFRGVNINSQGASISGFSGGGTGGKFSWFDCQFNGVVSGTPSFDGDVLDYGPQGVVYADRLGKNWTGQGNNVTFSTTTTGNTRTFTCLTAPGPAPTLAATSTLVAPSTWRDGELLYLVLVYESSKSITVSTVATPFGAPVITIVSAQPATTGTAKTALCFQVNATTPTGTLLQIAQTSTAVNDTLKIYECFLADSRMLNKGAGQVGNLYKC